MSAASGNYILTRGPSDIGAARGKDFSGIQFSFTFKVPVAVLIESVTFFGPHESEGGPLDYNVSIQIGESYAQGSAGKMTIYMEEQWWKVTAVKGSSFTVTFENAALVPANVWVEVLFQLDGPKTNFLHKDFMFETSYDLGGILVDTGVRGSSQLQEMQFRIA